MENSPVNEKPLKTEGGNESVFDIFTSRGELRKVLFLVLSVSGTFFVCV